MTHSPPPCTPDAPAPAPTAARPSWPVRWGRFAPWLVFIAVFALAWWGLSRNLDWPFYVQPDEIGKARQVVERKYNHHHPMLLLISAERAVKVLRETSDFQRNFQSVTEVGRAMAGMWIALGLAAIATIGWRWFGWLGVVAVLLAACGDTTNYERAHFFKEDGVMIGTFGLALLAFELWRSRREGGAVDNPAWPRLVCFGLATGLCAASKYIGFLILPPALLAVGLNLPKGRRLKPVLVCLGLFLAGFLLGNYRTVLEPQTAWRGVHHEFESLAYGSHGVRDENRDLPNWMPLKVLARRLDLALWTIVALLPLLVLWRTLRLRAATVWLAWSFPALVLVSLFCTPKFANRYLVPQIWTATLLLALLVAALLDLALRPGRRGWLRAFAGLAGLAMAWSIGNAQWRWTKPPSPTTLDFHRAYAAAAESRLPQAIAALPEDAVVMLLGRPIALADNSRSSRDIPRPWRQQVLMDTEVPSDPTLQRLRESGATHVLFQTWYASAYDDDKVGSERGVAEHLARRAFWHRVVEISERVDSEPLHRPSLPDLGGWELRRIDWGKAPAPAGPAGSGAVED